MREGRPQDAVRAAADAVRADLCVRPRVRPHSARGAIPVGLRSPGPGARPLYIWAVDALYELIETGVYGPGQPLPAEAELAMQLGVSRSTLREALGYLEKDGLIIRKHGVGTFVAPHSAQISGGLERLATFRSVAELAGASVQIVSRTVTLTEADEVAGRALQVPPGSELERVEVTEAVDGCTMVYLDGLIASKWVDHEKLASDEGSLLEYLVRQTHLPIAYSRSLIYAIGANQDLARRLGVPEGEAVLQLVETVYTDKDLPIAFFRNYFVTNGYHLKIVRRIAKVPGIKMPGIRELKTTGGSEHGTV